MRFDDIFVHSKTITKEEGSRFAYEHKAKINLVLNDPEPYLYFHERTMKEKGLKEILGSLKPL